jgi:drug resistance transporter, Bcr/CflA subfamily
MTPRTEGASPTLSRSQYARLILILGALAAFGPLSIDMYLPGFADIARDLDADLGRVQLTLPAFFIGLGIGQLFYGPLADRYGRIPPLRIGLVIYVLASIGCALAPDVEAMLVLRFVQALGSCAGMVIALAMVRDLFEARDVARVFSRMILVMGVAPIVAPFAGTFVLGTLGWRAIFWFLAFFGAACLVAVSLGLPETRSRTAGGRFRLGDVLRVYAHLLSERRFLGYTLLGALANAGLLVYITGAPFIFLEYLEVSPTGFSWLFALNAAGFIFGAQVNARLLVHFTTDALLRYANRACQLFALVLLLSALLSVRNVAIIVVPLFCFLFGLAFVRPNAMAEALAQHGERAGAAAALSGSLAFVIATAGGALLGALHDGTLVPFAGILTGLSVLGPVLLRAIVGPVAAGSGRRRGTRASSS